MKSGIARSLLRSSLLVVPWIVACADAKPGPAPVAATAAPVASEAAAKPVSPELLRGRELYRSYCMSCHSVDGRGLQALGIDLTSSRFVSGQTDEALAAFLRRGRQSDDPANRTGRLMPGVEGLPEIGEPEVAALVAQLRALNPPG